MEEKGEAKARKIDERVGKIAKISVEEVNLDYFKKNTTPIASPTSKWGLALTKSPSAKSNCLCSPTTHAGSFRCRHHRALSMPRGVSVGSNLSEFADKSITPATDHHLQAP